MPRKRSSLFVHRALPFFLFLALILLALGTLFIFDLSLVESARRFDDPYQLLRLHLLGLGIASLAFMVGFLIPSRVWLKLALPLYLLSLGLLLLIFVPGLGLTVHGAQSWLSLGPLRFQPVEFYKFAMLLYFSSWLLKKPVLKTMLLLISPAVLLLLLQPDLGSLLLVLGIAFVLYLIAGGQVRPLFLLGALSLPILVILVLVAPYRLQRFTTFLNPESDPQGASFHVRQMTLALGRGGFFGQGLGNSNQKFAYVPEASTDSIFALISEEIGFLGSLFIIACFLALFLAGFYLVKSYPGHAALQLFGYGLLTWLMAQTLLNLATVVALAPITGVPLPFFSYGRSSQVMVVVALAVIARLGIYKK